MIGATAGNDGDSCFAAKGRNAVDSHHIPQSGTHLLAPSARFAHQVDIPKWSAWPDLHLQLFHLERNVSSLVTNTKINATIGAGWHLACAVELRRFASWNTGLRKAN